MKRKSCTGVAVIGCDETNNDFRLCDDEYGFAYSKRGTCVYEKKGKCSTSLNILLSSVAKSKYNFVLNKGEINNLILVVPDVPTMVPTVAPNVPTTVKPSIKGIA